MSTLRLIHSVSVMAVFKWQQKEAVLTNRPSPRLPRQGNDRQLALLAALEKERTKWKCLWEQTRARTPLGRSAVLCCAFPICLLSLASRSSAQETPRQRVYPSGSSTRMCFSSDCEVRLWIILVHLSLLCFEHQSNCYSNIQKRQELTCSGKSESFNTRQSTK